MENGDIKSFGDEGNMNNSSLDVVKEEQKEKAQQKDMSEYDSDLSLFGERVESGDAIENDAINETVLNKTAEEADIETQLAETPVEASAETKTAEEASEFSKEEDESQQEEQSKAQISQTDPFDKLYRNSAPIYHVPTKPQKKRKKRSTGSRVALFGIIIILLLSMTVLVTEYDISFGANSDGLEITLKDKDSGYYGDDWYSDSVPSDWSDDGSYYNSESTTQMTVYPTADGTTLTVSEAQGELYSLQDVYSKCIDSIVSVNVAIEGGYGTGTGIIMSSNGYIITNDHVVDGGTSISIELQNGAEYEAILIGRDSQTDLAVLKIEVTDLTPAEFGDSTSLRVGDQVAAIGNPLGLNFSLSNGIISALDRDVEVNGYYMTMIQTNAAINEGNSGGALINMYGQVIGITNMKLVSYSAYSTIEGMAFAIPTNVVKPVVDSLIQQGYVGGRPALGIMCATLSEAEANSRNLPTGIYISSIYETSDAYGKLQEGDVITAANGTEVKSNDELNDVKNTLSVGDNLTLTIYREGETFDVDILLVDSVELD